MTLAMKCVKAATPKISRPGFEFWKNQQREDGEEPLEAEGGKGVKTKGGKTGGHQKVLQLKVCPDNKAACSLPRPPSPREGIEG